MENGHEIRRDDVDEIEDEEFEEAGPLDADENEEADPIDIDEEPPKSLSPVFSVVMPCTSTTDAADRPSVHGATPRIWDSFEDIHLSDEGEDAEYGDAEDVDTGDDQQGDLTVTFRSEETNEEIATATLILKQHDSVDRFLPFAGAILRSIANEQLKLKLMQDISQILINAKTEEIERYRPPRSQYIMVLFAIPCNSTPKR